MGVDQRLNLIQRLAKYRQYSLIDRDPIATGRLTRMVGLALEAVGLNVSVGRQCEVTWIDSGTKLRKVVNAEVVGFQNEKTFLMPVQKIDGIQPGASVVPLERFKDISIGPHLIGRVVNGIGQPLDSLGAFQDFSNDYVESAMINPLDRHPIEQPLDVGVRAINGLVTVGKGQRLGLFAGSGVGKSVLMGMMTRFTEADIVIVGLIGERGREVKEFVDQILGEEGLKKSVVVAAPADEAPLMRLKAAQLATKIAEYFRDQGKNVLLLMDSLTRFAQAQREISLAIGEPPATKGYPPSVFAKIPELVERAGNGEKGGGSITAFYTVLTEGDDIQDPIADAARAILDGHVVLSRQLAEEGLYPAIDIEASISRVMPSITSEAELKLAQQFKYLLSKYRANKDLISIGAYSSGSDAEIDLAIEKRPYLKAYIAQGIGESAMMKESIDMLKTLLQAKPNKGPIANENNARAASNQGNAGNVKSRLK